MQEDLLPLFPLGVVLFPRTPLPLHIFEDRYKEMIGQAARDNSEFGVVLAAANGIANIGCTATVEKVVKRFPDGRMNILAAGRRRFEIMLINEERDYLRAAVTFFDDEESAPSPPEWRNQALGAYQTLRDLGEAEPITESQLADPQLSFQLAQVAPDAGFRQALLAMRSEAERMRRVAAFLAEYAAKRKQTDRLKRVVGGNGHSRFAGRA